MRVDSSSNIKQGEVINDACYRRHRRHDSRKSSSRRKQEPLPSFEGTMIDISPNNNENLHSTANKEGEVPLKEALSEEIMEHEPTHYPVSAEEEEQQQRQDEDNEKNNHHTPTRQKRETNSNNEANTTKPSTKGRCRRSKKQSQQLITKEDAQIQHLSKLQYLVQKFNNSVTKHRMESLDKLCECLDHSDDKLHNLEIQMGVPNILYQKLVFVLSLNNTLVIVNPPAATAIEHHHPNIRKPKPRYPLPSVTTSNNVSSLQNTGTKSSSNIASTTTTTTGMTRNPTTAMATTTANTNLEEEISMMCCAFEMIYCRSSSTEVIRHSLKDNNSMVSLFLKLLNLYVQNVIHASSTVAKKKSTTSKASNNDVQVIGAPLSFSSTTSSCSIDTTYFDEPSAPIGEGEENVTNKQNVKVDVEYDDEDESEVLLFSPSRRVKRIESTDDEQEHDDDDKRDDDEHRQHRRRHRTKGEEEDEYYEDHYRNHRRISSRSSLNKANKESVGVGIGVVSAEAGTGTAPSITGASSNNNILILSSIQSLLKVCCTFVQMGDPMEFRKFVINTHNYLFLSTIQSLLKWKRSSSNQQQRNKLPSSLNHCTDDNDQSIMNDVIACALETIGYFASEDDNEEECSSEILLTLLDHKWNFVDHILWYATRSSDGKIRTKASFAMMNVISRTHKSHFSTRQIHHILDSLLIILEDSQKVPRKYAGASLFNLAYGGHYHIELVTYQNGAFLTALEHILSCDKDKKSRSNAAWVLFYLVNHNDHDDVDGNHKSASTSTLVRRTISSKESLLMLFATLVKQDHSLIKVPAAKTLRVLSETITPNDIPCHSILLQALRHAAATTTTASE